MKVEQVAVASVGALLALVSTTHAFAYRPFDGTDADVAALHEVELEVGPVGYERKGQVPSLVAPALVFNYGLVPRVEAVLEARQLWVLGASRYSSLQDVSLFLKGVLREGSLQGGQGISVAVEAGPLLPGSERRLGGHIASIFSWRCPAASFHLNLDNDLLTSIRYLATVGLIVEGPDSWRVRPVAEAFLVRDFGSSRFRDGLERSLLVGAIVSWSDAWVFDAALRRGSVDGVPVDEARLGLTWSFSVD